ncbi:Cof-type HAD-IIB family hydrolase [Sulfobacillus harzensis]|uniref:HAD family phosphatase n=1 Tax=Sulfobacillus harzensis TaxID=2729629 RepID=A0A7Y0L580_9FIRM|nr:Cof-type HAD-IIB family hydrolase [Sulfobacillus harzensis]NMP22665.1 HAD family phosphatase [Sulfobacillus harzensis]
MGHSSSIALIALDLDGTTLKADGSISDRLQAAVGKALERGIRVMLATGRMVQSAEPFWRELKLPPGLLVAYQGAVVADMPSGKLVAKTLLPDEGARAAVRWALDREMLTQVYVGTELWVSREDPRVRQYIEKNHIPAWVRTAEEMLQWPEPPIKVLLQDEPEVLDRVRRHLEPEVARFPIRVFKSQPDYLELVHQDVGKAVGLAAAAQTLNIPQQQVMAIGDAENDIDMLKWAGLGVAMGQAPDAVKQAAQVVTAPISEDGAARAIERYALGMPVVD